jgi:hypothetical protein
MYHEGAETLTPYCLESNGPDRRLALPITSLVEPSPPSPSSGSNNVSSSMQIVEPSTTGLDTLPESSLTNGLLNSELNSRTITAQALLDLSSNPRLSISTKAVVKSHRVSKQQYPSPLVSSFRRSAHKEATDREKSLDLIPKRAQVRMKGNKIGLADVGSGTFTAAQRNFILNNIAAGPIVMASSKDESPVHLENETHEETEDTEDEDTVVEDPAATAGGSKLKLSSTGGKFPPIRPVIEELPKIFALTEMEIDPELDLYSAEDNEEPVARPQSSIATIPDVEDKVLSITEAAIIGPTAIFRQNPLETAT